MSKHLREHSVFCSDILKSGLLNNLGQEKGGYFGLQKKYRAMSGYYGLVGCGCTM